MPSADDGRSPAPDQNQEEFAKIEHELGPQTNALWLVVVVLLAGAAMMLGSILVPFFLALVLAVAMAPVVTWLEQKGWPTTLGSLACMLAVAAALGLTLGLMVYQAGSILQESDQYIGRVAELVSRISGRTGGDPIMRSLGLLQTPKAAAGRAGAMVDDSSQPRSPAPNESMRSWEDLLRRNFQLVGRWVVTGLGGLLGILAGGVIFLAFLFYMLQTRADWIGRLTRAFARLGLRPKARDMRRTRREIEVFVGFVSLVATCYAIVGTLVFWGLGLPQPLLWGLLTGLLEFIPFFGPLIAGSLITLVALTLGTIWQPLAVVAFFIGLHLVEGYVITPMVYGKAVQIDPVTVLLGVLVFGWIWGPIGSMLAMPMMILIRGLIVMFPDTPALDALADVEDRKEYGKPDQPSPSRTAT